MWGKKAGNCFLVLAKINAYCNYFEGERGNICENGYENIQIL